MAISHNAAVTGDPVTEMAKEIKEHFYMVVLFYGP